MGAGDISAGVKLPGRVVDLSPPSSAEVNERSYTSPIHVRHLRVERDSGLRKCLLCAAGEDLDYWTLEGGCRAHLLKIGNCLPVDDT
jgi:hypothetical protein